jgi:hypothetical protein
MERKSDHVCQGESNQRPEEPPADLLYPPVQNHGQEQQQLGCRREEPEKHAGIGRDEKTPGVFERFGNPRGVVRGHDD